MKQATAECVASRLKRLTSHWSWLLEPSRFCGKVRLPCLSALSGTLLLLLLAESLRLCDLHGKQQFNAQFLIMFLSRPASQGCILACETDSASG